MPGARRPSSGFAACGVPARQPWRDSWARIEWYSFRHRLRGLGPGAGSAADGRLWFAVGARRARALAGALPGCGPALLEGQVGARSGLCFGEGAGPGRCDRMQMEQRRLRQQCTRGLSFLLSQRTQLPHLPARIEGVHEALWTARSPRLCADGGEAVGAVLKSGWHRPPPRPSASAGERFSPICTRQRAGPIGTSQKVRAARWLEPFRRRD